MNPSHLDTGLGVVLIVSHPFILLLSTHLLRTLLTPTFASSSLVDSGRNLHSAQRLLLVFPSTLYHPLALNFPQHTEDFGGDNAI